MRAAYSRKFLAQFSIAPRPVQAAFEKQLCNLLENLRHPSIQAKKYDVHRGIWQGRVNLSWRFYFRISGDVFELLQIRKHPK